VNAFSATAADARPVFAPGLPGGRAAQIDRPEKELPPPDARGGHLAQVPDSGWLLAGRLIFNKLRL
jgi:hypothetical protein